MSNNLQLNELTNIISAAVGVNYVEGIPMQLVPKDMELKNLESLMDAPARKEGKVFIYTQDDFILFINEYKRPMTKIFLNRERCKFVAILDYHESDRAQWCRDAVEYIHYKTQEWDNWLANNKRRFDQLAFAEFIESNMLDIVEPTSAYILEFVTQLSVKTESHITSAVRLANGNQSLSYTEESKTTGGRSDIEIPPKIALGLRPFRGAPIYRVDAYLRIRIVERKPVFSYELIRPEKIVDAYLDESKTNISTKTERAIFDAEVIR